MQEITSEIEQLLFAILDKVYEPENAGCANELIIAIISKLAIMGLFYQSMNQMKKGISDISFRSKEKRALSSEFPIKPDYDKILNDIMRGKDKPQ